MNATVRAEGKLTGRHVLIVMLGFFGLIFAVNGYFLYAALATHTGVVANEPYRKGLAYNDRIAAEARQNALGWRQGVTLAPDGKALVATFADRSGNAVTGLVLSGQIGRPSTGSHDVVLRFEETAPGRYTASFSALPRGGWLVDLQAAREASAGEDVVFRSRRRLWLKP